MNAIKKIGVIGGTGSLGKPVVRELIKAGFDLTLLVRNRSRLDQSFSKAKIVEGDIRNAEALTNLMTGVDALYINLNLVPGEKKTDFHAESDGLELIIRQARQSGIKRIVFISSLVMQYQGMNNFHWWVFDVKQKALDLIRSSGIPYTLFFPSSFMENFEGNYRQGKNLMLAGTSHHKMYFIAGADYGKQVAKSFNLDPGLNYEFPVQGTEGFTSDEATEVYRNNYTREKLGVKKAPLALLKVLSMFSPKMSYAANIIEALNNYPEKFESEKTWSTLGKPAITLAEYARQKSSD